MSRSKTSIWGGQRWLTLRFAKGLPHKIVHIKSTPDTLFITYSNFYECIHEGDDEIETRIEKMRPSGQLEGRSAGKWGCKKVGWGLDRVGCHLLVTIQWWATWVAAGKGLESNDMGGKEKKRWRKATGRERVKRGRPRRDKWKPNYKSRLWSRNVLLRARHISQTSKKTCQRIVKVRWNGVNKTRRWQFSSLLSFGSRHRLCDH